MFISTNLIMEFPLFASPPFFLVETKSMGTLKRLVLKVQCTTTGILHIYIGHKMQCQSASPR